MKLKPFNTLPLIKFFQQDLEKIKMAFRLSDTIRKDVKNIRAAGDEVELAVKEFFQKKLFPNYHICDGHIVDANLKVSPQYDLIISDNTKNSVLFNLADKSELVYFEPVYLFAEIKRSLYKKTLIEDFSLNLQRFKNELKRKEIEPNFLDTGSTGLLIEAPLTTLPLRNPILSFMFFVDGSSLDMDYLGNFLNRTANEFLPNYIVFLNIGIVVNLNKTDFEKGVVNINLYPEYETDDSIWALIDIDDENNALIYQYMLALEHLNSSIVSTPDVRQYTTEIFNFSLSDIHKL